MKIEKIVPTPPPIAYLLEMTEAEKHIIECGLQYGLQRYAYERARFMDPWPTSPIEEKITSILKQIQNAK